MPVMTTLQIAALYIALNAIVTIVLAFNVVRVRVKTQTQIGDGGKEEMLRAIRAHGNNVEYVPLTLVALVTLALLQSSILILHVVGVALTVGRVLHGLGLNTNSGASLGRGLGIMLTLVALITAIVALLLKVFS